MVDCQCLNFRNILVVAAAAAAVSAAEVVILRVFVPPTAPSELTSNHRCRILGLSAHCPLWADHWSDDRQWTREPAKPQVGQDDACRVCSLSLHGVM